jgi:hypothetical protein
MSNLPEIQARFSIRGNLLDLPGITAALGLDPTSARKAGSRLENPHMPRVDLWTRDGAPRRSVDAEAAISELVNVLDSVHEQLTDLQSSYPQASFDLVLVAYIGHQDAVMPDITLPKELVARIARLGVRFAVSLYVVDGPDAANLLN